MIMGILEDAIAERDRRNLLARAIAERDRRAGVATLEPDREGQELASGDFPEPEPLPVTRPGPAREFQNVADEFIRALGRGTLNVGSGLLSTFADVAVDSLFDAEKIQDLADTAREAAQSPKFQPGTDAGVKGFIANAVGDALPFMAGTIGATLVGGPSAGFGVAYSVEGKNAYFDALDAGATQAQAEMEGMIVGSINAAIELMQIGKIKKFAKAGKGSIEVVAREGKKNAIKNIVKLGKNLTKEGVELAITEGLQEATQETVSVLAPLTTGRELQEEGKLKRIAQAGAGGAVAGVFLGGAGRISQSAASRFGIEVDEEGTPIQPEGQRFESEVAATLAGLQARAEAKAKIAENIPLESAEREQFPELARQEDQIAQIRATDIRTLPEAPPEGLAEAPVAKRPVEGAIVEPVKAVQPPTEAKPAKIIVPEQIQKGKPFKPVSKKGPGLTQAEQAVLTPEQQEQFRFKQTQGEKAGFKAGMQEALVKNREKIKNFQLAEKLSTENRTEALEVVKQFVPKEKQAVFTRRILDAKTPKRVDRITQAVQLFIDKAEKRAAVRDFKAFLNKTNKEFRRGEVKLGKLPTDIRQRVLKVVDQFDPAKITEKKRKQLEKRDSFIKRVSGTVAEAFESLEDAGADILQIPNARTQELQRLSKVSIGSLSTEQINYINSSLDHLIQIARKRGESKERARSERVAKQVNAARQEVSKRTKDEGIIKQPTGVAGLFGSVFVQGQSSIRTMTGRATVKNNKATMDLLVENIQDAKRNEHEIIRKFSEASEKAIAKDLGFTAKDSAEFDKLVSIKLGGKRFRIDLDNLFSIYMAIRADGNLRQLLNSEGLNITVVERDARTLNVIKSKKQILTGKVQLSEVREVVKIIEAIPKFKELAQTTFDINKDVVSPKVNKTSVAFQNFEIARKDKYWPQPRSLAINIEGKATDVSVAIEQQGMFLPKRGGSARLLIRPYRSQFVNILQTSAQFAATTLQMRDAKALLGNKQWQDNMRKAGRGAELKGLIMMFRRMQGLSTDKAFVDLAGAKLLNNFGKSVLSLRLSGYGVQTASIPAAYEFIDPKYFKTTEIIRKAARIPAKNIQEMIDLSPTLWIRWKAKQFNYVTGGVAAQHSFNNMILSKTPLLDKFLTQYTWGDQKAIKIIFDAAQNKVASEQNLKKGTAENKTAAIKETERAIETQPNWDITYRSPLTSSPNVFLRGSLMFQSARNAQMNVLMRAVDDFNKGRIGATEAGKRMGGVLYANTLVAIVKRLLKFGIKAAILGLIFAFGDEDKKEQAVGAIATEGKKDALRLPQDTVINLIGLPAFGNIPANIANETIRSFKRPSSSFRDIANVRTGNFFTDLTLDAAAIGISAGSLGKNLLTQEEITRGPREGRPKWKDDAEDMAAGIAELIAIRYGLPLAAPKQEIFFQTKAALRAVEQKPKPKKKKRSGFSK